MSWSWIGLRGEMRGGVACFHEQSREGLADFIVQFARDRSALFFLCGDQAGGELLQLLAGADAFFVTLLEFLLQAQGASHGEGGEDGSG